VTEALLVVVGVTCWRCAGDRRPLAFPLDSLEKRTVVSVHGFSRAPERFQYTVRSLLILTAAAAILAAFVKEYGVLPVVLVAVPVVLFLGAFVFTQIITFLIDFLSLIARSALAVRGKRSRRRDLVNQPPR
jgi:hypothetical protein